MELPACDDWMVQVPVATSVTFLLLTVHLFVVRLVKVTVKPELAVALALKKPSLSGLFGNGPNVIVWLAIPITSVPVALGAV